MITVINIQLKRPRGMDIYNTYLFGDSTDCIFEEGLKEGVREGVLVCVAERVAAASIAIP